MSEFGGFWKHKNSQHALVLPKTECGCPSGGGIKNGHIRYPSYGGTQKKRYMLVFLVSEQILQKCAMSLLFDWHTLYRNRVTM